MSQKFKKTADYIANPALKAALESNNVVVLEKIAGTEAGKVHVLLAMKAPLNGVASALSAVGRNVKGAYRRTAMFNMDATSMLALQTEGNQLPEFTIIRQQFSSKSKRALRDGKLRSDALPYLGGIAVDKDGNPVFQDMIIAMKGTPDQPSIVANSITKEEFEVYSANWSKPSVTVDTTGVPANISGANKPEVAPIGG